MARTQTTEKPHIRRAGRYLIQISSRTRPTLLHTVNVLTLRCTCEAGQHGIRCWHLAWALQAEQWYARAQAEFDARKEATRSHALARRHDQAA